MPSDLDQIGVFCWMQMLQSQASGTTDGTNQELVRECSAYLANGDLGVELGCDAQTH